MYEMHLSKYFLVIFFLLISIVIFIYLLNFSVDNIISNIRDSLHFKNTTNINIKYLTYNSHSKLKDEIKHHFMKFIMLLSEKKYNEMMECDWINKDLIKKLQKYNL